MSSVTGFNPLVGVASPVFDHTDLHDLDYFQRVFVSLPKIDEPLLSLVLEKTRACLIEEFQKSVKECGHWIGPPAFFYGFFYEFYLHDKNELFYNQVVHVLQKSCIKRIEELQNIPAIFKLDVLAGIIRSSSNFIPKIDSAHLNSDLFLKEGVIPAYMDHIDWISLSFNEPILSYIVSCLKEKNPGREALIDSIQRDFDWRILKWFSSPINWHFYDEHSVRMPGFEVLAFLFSVELSDDQVAFAKETMAEIIPFLKTLSAEPMILKKIISVLFVSKDLILIRGFFADLMLEDSLDAKEKKLDLILSLIKFYFEFGLKFTGFRTDLHDLRLKSEEDFQRVSVSLRKIDGPLRSLVLEKTRACLIEEFQESVKECGHWIGPPAFFYHFFDIFYLNDKNEIFYNQVVHALQNSCINRIEELGKIPEIFKLDVLAGIIRSSSNLIPSIDSAHLSHDLFLKEGVIPAYIDHINRVSLFLNERILSYIVPCLKEKNPGREALIDSIQRDFDCRIFKCFSSPINWGFYDEHSVRMPGFEVLVFLVAVELSHDQVVIAQETLAQITPFLETLREDSNILKRITLGLCLSKNLSLIKDCFTDFSIEDASGNTLKKLRLTLDLIDLYFQYKDEFSSGITQFKSDELIDKFLELFIEKKILDLDKKAVFNALVKECTHVKGFFYCILSSLNEPEIIDFIRLICMEGDSCVGGAGAGLGSPIDRVNALESVRDERAAVFLNLLKPDQKNIWQESSKLHLDGCVVRESQSWIDLVLAYTARDCLDGNNKVVLLQAPSGEGIEQDALRLAQTEDSQFGIFVEGCNPLIINLAREKAKIMGLPLFVDRSFSGLRKTLTLSNGQTVIARLYDKNLNLLRSPLFV
jgi:hypothetical protein